MKYQEKYPSRFDFIYNPENITYRTDIPELPEKTKHRPDEKGYTKQIN